MAIKSVSTANDLVRQVQQPKPQDQTAQTGNATQTQKTRQAQEQAAQQVQQSQQTQSVQRPKGVVNAQGQTIGTNISISA